jgi:hypothetical protein
VDDDLYFLFACWGVRGLVIAVGLETMWLCQKIMDKTILTADPP